MKDNGGEGLFILAAIVIAFINWLSNTLKKKAAARDSARRQMLGDQPPPTPDVESDGWPEPDSWPEPDVHTPATQNSQDIRDFFAALTGGSSEQPQPEPPYAPTVIHTMEAPPEHVAPARRAPTRSSAPEIRKKKRHPIIAQLRTSHGARHAILLAEIIGKPKGLADNGSLS